MARSTPPGARRSSSRWALPALVAVALLVKAVVLYQLHDHVLLQPSPVLDDGVYVRLASRVAAGDLALGPEVYYLSPFYTYFMALIFSVTGGATLAVRVVQVCLGAGAVAFVYGTARRLFGERAALVAGILAAATGLFSFFEILLLQTAVDPFLTALALYAFTRALQAEGNRWAALGAGAALGLLATNRPNALAFVPVAAIALLIVGRAGTPAPHAVERSRRGLLRAAALLLGATLVIAPITLRNAVVAGDWVLISSHGGLNLYIGNNPRADGTYRAVEGITPSIQGQLVDAKAVAERAAGRPLKPSEVSAYFAARSLDWASSHVGRAIRLFLVKLWYVFHGADLALNYSYTYYSRDEPTLLRWLLVGPWLLVPLGLVGLVAGWTVAASRRQFVAWASFIPVYALSVAVFFVSTRYRLALLVPLAVTASAAVVWAVDIVRGRRTRLVAGAAAALAGLALVANWPIGPDTGRMDERTQMVVHLIGAGETGRAEALLAPTAGRHPDPAMLYLQVGQAYFRRGDAQKAIAAFEKGLAASPGQAEVHLSLGQALEREGRFAEAVPHLRAARDAGVAPDVSRLSLSNCLAEVGRPDEARAVLREAEAAAPADTPEQVWVDLGLVALRLQDPAAGERFFRRAVAANPRSAVGHEKLGLSLILQERASEAIGALERAAALDPASATIRYNLAVALAREGRLAEAAGAARAALLLQPDYPQARTMLEQLGQER